MKLTWLVLTAVKLLIFEILIPRRHRSQVALHAATALQRHLWVGMMASINLLLKFIDVYCCGDAGTLPDAACTEMPGLGGNMRGPDPAFFDFVPEVFCAWQIRASHREPDTKSWPVSGEPGMVLSASRKFSKHQNTDPESFWQLACYAHAVAAPALRQHFLVAVLAGLWSEEAVAQHFRRCPRLGFLSARCQRRAAAADSTRRDRSWRHAGAWP